MWSSLNYSDYPQSLLTSSVSRPVFSPDCSCDALLGHAPGVKPEDAEKRHALSHDHQQQRRGEDWVRIGLFTALSSSPHHEWQVRCLPIFLSVIITIAVTKIAINVTNVPTLCQPHWFSDSETITEWGRRWCLSNSFLVAVNFRAKF